MTYVYRRREPDLNDPVMQAAIAEMEELIRQRYPDATFSAEYGHDPDGVYLIATVDLEDTDEVVDAYIDRLIDLQVYEGLALHVLPLRTPERIAAIRAEQEQSEYDAVRPLT